MFRLLRSGVVDLRELVFEQAQLALARTAELTQLLELGLQALAQAVGVGTHAQARGLIGAAQVVEDLQLGAREGQLAVLVLTVEGDEPGAEVAQLGDGHGASVQIRARAPAIRIDAPRQDDLLSVAGKALAELLAQRVGELEHALDVCLAGARAHDCGRGSGASGATSKQQVQRVREHGLTGAGLAGEHVQPGSQPQLGALDQQQVLDVQLRQHDHAGVPANGDGLVATA